MNEQLDPDSFTIVSADNIDFMYAFARVHKGNTNASWHGTSVRPGCSTYANIIPNIFMDTQDHTTVIWSTNEVNNRS